jgi:hypothetical protein
MVDEGVQTTYYQDLDGDTYGNPAVTQSACSAPSGYVSNNLDCNDNSNTIYSGAPELCNSEDDNCNSVVDDLFNLNGASAWYPFNGNAIDESINTNDGTVINANLTADRNNMADKAYAFNGTSSRISVANHSTMNSSNLSIGFWIQYNNMPPANNFATIISKPNSSGYDDTYEFFFNQNKIKCYTSLNSSASTVTLQATPPASGWVYLTMVFDDDNNKMSLYLNGIKADSATVNFSLTYAATAVSIGADWANGNLGYFFEGKIDDIRYFNRVLSSTEIFNIYNEGIELCNSLDDDCDGMVDEGLIQTNTFASNAGSTLWSNNTNWSTGQLPTMCDDVIIDPGNSVNVDIINAKARSLWVKPGAFLNIPQSKLLEIYYGNGIFSTKNEGIINILGQFKDYKN